VRLRVVAAAKVIGVRVDHHAAPDDAIRSPQLDEAVDHLALCTASHVCFDVPEIAHVAVLVVGTAVVLAKRVIVRSGGDAAVAEVGALVNVEAVLSWRQASDIPRDQSVAIGLLGQRDGARDPPILQLWSKLLDDSRWWSGSGRTVASGGRERCIHGLLCHGAARFAAGTELTRSDQVPN